MPALSMRERLVDTSWPRAAASLYRRRPQTLLLLVNPQQPDKQRQASDQDGKNPQGSTEGSTGPQGTLGKPVFSLIFAISFGCII